MAASQREENPQTPPSEWLSAIFARLELPLVGYSHKQLRGDMESARDVVQEAFVKLCQQPWPEIESHATAWLYRTCRNRAIDILRREGRMNRSSTAEVSTLHDRTGTSAEGTVSQCEQLDLIRATLSLLPDRQQELLRLRLHENLSYKQIAEVTGLTATNVGYQLHQAIAKLRSRIVVDE